MERCHLILPPAGALLLGALLLVPLLATARPAAAQEGVPLFLVNDATTVDGVDFRFVSTRTFDKNRLEEQVATEGPTFLDKVWRVLPILSAEPHPFAPLQLQRDVARLRAFYVKNGFLQPEISYAPTVLDTSANEIDVIFSIEEGPPLIIQDVTFYGPDSTGYAVRQFEGAMRERWIELRDRNPHRVGERYTALNRIRIQDEALLGLKNAGFAFARTGSEVRVDSTNNVADLRYYIDAGPRARISEIQVQGNESVGREVVLRELPFEEGDWFSADDVAQGQRELFGLQLFRVALAEVPPQPRDSTVTVRYNVREASLRYVTAEGGYARDLGATGEGRWTHRNFLGDARELSLGLIANTGFGAASDLNQFAPPRLFRASASLRQPFLFTTELSGVATVFAEFESNPQLVENPGQRLALNAGEVGLSATAIYEFMPFRTATAQYALSRTLQFRPDIRLNDDASEGEVLPADSSASISRDLFNRSILTLNATLGRANDYVSPTRGFLVRPFLEAGLNVPIRAGVEYLKVGGQVTGYHPLTDRINLAGRVQGGRVWLYGRSAEALGGQRRFGGPFSTYENRFDPIYFYAGGSTDVRGWGPQQAGAKFARGVIADRDETVPGADYLYEAVGGRAKLTVSGEVRMPFPGLGENWRTAAFLDAGEVWNAESPVVEIEGPLEEQNAPDDLSLSNFRYGAGGGVRYRTPVGYLRLDLALKINPTFEDLRDPRDVFEYNQCRTSLVATGCDAPDASNWRRLRLHLSIGQSF